MKIVLIYFPFILVLISCHSFVRETIQHREEYKSEFLTDERSPLVQEDLAFLDFYPPHKKGVVLAKFILTPESENFELPTYSGVTRTYRKWGEAYFKWEQDSARLNVYENIKLLSNPEYQDYLFLPFTDETNDVTTYGGGRYLDLSKKDTEDGMITIDFNRCYNPWCAFSDGYNCPVPPAENYLPFKVEAGEKKFKGVQKVKH
jgi:uncharacterized protein (DUF1684 family)